MSATRAETLPGLLFAHAAARPDHVALREKHRGLWREVTWAGYRDAVAATARALAAIGVERGDHVAILSDNRPEWLYADLGAQLIGARSVGIYQTNPPTDVAWILNHCRAPVIFCEDQEQVDKVVFGDDDLPALRRVVVIDPRGTRAYDDPRLVSWADFLALGEAEADPRWAEAQLAARDPAEPTMVVYTSGTTGRPKGALLSSKNALAAASAMVPALGIGASDSVLSYLPLCHVAEKIFSLFMPLQGGAVVHFGESLETVREDLREVSPTVFLGVPRIWEKMAAGVQVKMRNSTWFKQTLYKHWTKWGRAVAERGGPRGAAERVWAKIGDLVVLRPLQERLGLRRCRLAFSGAAPIGADLLWWFRGIGLPIHEGYGQTEDGGVTHYNPPGAVRIGTVGVPLPGVECQLADDGELLVRGAVVFPGYLHDPEATAATVDADGWLHTGDVGEIDAEGRLRITGRKKEIIITAGGKNLSPEKIENALKSSPYVKEAVALGDGERFVAALIQIEPDTVGDRMMRRGVVYTSFEDLSARPEVVKLIAEEVDRANAQLARVEQVRAFRLFPKELHQDDGELTATQKVRRKAVMAAWAPLVEDLYRSK